MADFPYILVPGRLKDFLAHIQSAGVPPKLTVAYLEKVGFKSKNDRRIIGVLKHIGFVESNGVPTDRWQQYRNKARAAKILGSALREAYPDLFNTYPDAATRDNDTLRNYFSAHTKVGDRALSGMVQTFKVLAELANFERIELDEINESPGNGSLGPSHAGSQHIERVVTRTANGVVINVNIQIAVPETEKPEVYDLFFASLKKHVLSDD